MDEKVILQVLAEQREEMSGYDVSGWVSRPEEDFFEWDSDMAQVVIGVRRSGKSTLCHKALIQHGVKYGYSDLMMIGCWEWKPRISTHCWVACTSFMVLM